VIEYIDADLEIIREEVDHLKALGRLFRCEEYWRGGGEARGRGRIDAAAASPLDDRLHLFLRRPGHARGRHRAILETRDDAVDSARALFAGEQHGVINECVGGSEVGGLTVASSAVTIDNGRDVALPGGEIRLATHRVGVGRWVFVAAGEENRQREGK